MNTFEMKTAIHFGADALGRLRDIPYKRVLVITDPFVVKSGMIDMITKPLQAGGKEFDIFCDVVPDAPVGKIAEGVKKFLQYQPEAIVAVGGGSAIDSSKAIREFALKINNYGKVGLVAIPTTSGTGSEVTSALAEKAIEICGVYLYRAYVDGNDMHARQKMHVASCLAGLSFNAAGLGITHSMAHQLGAIFHIPHGRANAMLLPHIVEYNANINKRSRSQKEYLPAVKRYSNIAHLLGLSNYNEVMSVRSLVNWIQFMQKEMNIPLTIEEMKTITPDAYFAAVDKMADMALADACTAANPRVPKKEDIIKIYTKLWSF